MHEHDRRARLVAIQQSGPQPDDACEHGVITAEGITRRQTQLGFGLER